MPKLTDNTIRNALKAAATSTKPMVVLRDADPVGLALRVRKTGRHSWVYFYRRPGLGRAGRVQTVTIGNYPDVDLATARAKAKTLVAGVVSGADPATDRRVEKLREKRLLATVIDEYVADLRSRRIVKADQIKSALTRGLDGLKGHEVDALTRADFIEAVRALEAQKLPGAASYLRTCSRTLLEWAVNEGLLRGNPLAGWRKPKASRAEKTGESRRKGRALDDAEIKAVWAACEGITPFGGLVRLALLTGMRRNELSGLKWSDIKADRITIEANRAKTGEEHMVPLTSAMKAILNQQPRTKSPLVFASMKRPGAELSGWSKLLPRLINKAGVAPFTIHDLRRSCRTIMSRCGVPDDMGELAIGHAPERLLSLYNYDARWSGRSDAFVKVSDHIVGLLQGAGPSNVAPMKRGAKS